MMMLGAGVALFAIGAGFIYAGFLARRRGLAVRRAGLGRSPDAGGSLASLAVFGDIMRPIMLCALGWVALKATFFYWAFHGRRVIPVPDFAAFLFFLAGFGTWFVFRTKYSIVGRTPDAFHEPPPPPLPQPDAVPPLPARPLRAAREIELVE